MSMILVNNVLFQQLRTLPVARRTITRLISRRVTGALQRYPSPIHSEQMQDAAMKMALPVKILDRTPRLFDVGFAKLLVLFSSGMVELSRLVFNKPSVDEDPDDDNPSGAPASAAISRRRMAFRQLRTGYSRADYLLDLAFTSDGTGPHIVLASGRQLVGTSNRASGQVPALRLLRQFLHAKWVRFVSIAGVFSFG